VLFFSRSHQPLFLLFRVMLCCSLMRCFPAQRSAVLHFDQDGAVLLFPAFQHSVVLRCSVFARLLP
jgi:hypothetical protein